MFSTRWLTGLAAAAGVSLSTASWAQCTGFTVSTSPGAAIVPTSTDSGNHGDDTVTNLPLPFPVTLYGVTYTAASASSNGNLQFGTASGAYFNECLPTGQVGISLMPHWDDLRTDGAGRGIFTSVSGSAPNRVFNIEWRAAYYDTGAALNFQVRLFEDGSKVEYIYGTIPQGGSAATVGAQHTTYPHTQFACNSGGLSSGLKITLTCTSGPLPPQGTGGATPGNVFACGAGSSTLLTVQASSGFNPPSTGLAVTGNLASIGGPADQPFYDDGSHGDTTPGDLTFSFQAPVPISTPIGTRAIQFTVSDDQQRSNTGSFSLNVSPCPTAGPDVYIGNISDVSFYGTVDVDPSPAVLNVSAFSVGTDACNQGDVPVLWIDHDSTPGYFPNQHPVIAQNMYRLKNGVMEQIGQSWLKHGFVSTNSQLCSTQCVPPPMGGDQLGVNCSDLYGSFLNGNQPGLGPRSEVNATTGVFPWPFGQPPAVDPTIGKRLQVYTSDVTPALNPGAVYIVDGHYVTQDDAQFTTGASPASNGLNNHSYRMMNASSLLTNPVFAGNTVRYKAGIHAWRDLDSSVELANAHYTDTSLVAAGITARFVVAAKVSDNGNGTWRYEYAVYNTNADRAAGAFRVPVDPAASVTNIGFHGVFAHSGEPFPNTALNPSPWSGSKVGAEVIWSCAPYNPADGGNSSNALRWGTMYNFRFDCDRPPQPAPVTVGLFKPATPASPATEASTLLKAPISPCGTADFDGDGDTGTDADIEAFFACMAGNCCPTCWHMGVDFDGDGDVGTDADIESFFRVLAGGNC